MRIDSLVPRVGCLFETVEAFQQAADVVGMVVGDKSFGLCNVDFFSEMCMEEGSINIHLVDFQVEGSSKGQQETQILEADDKGKDLIIVNAMNLREAFGYLVCFVVLDRSISSGLDLVEPAGVNNVAF